ncbi:MAG: hypothetical protein K2M34_02825 [Alphaproteobacteria bacterium]|nr:hypothetical protein [Alphaproteobacteria bacterium]
MTDKELNKELMRRCKAETIGRLAAAGMMFAAIWLFGDKDSEATKAAVPNDNKETVFAKQEYADSARNLNAIKIDTLQSRSK